MPLPDPKLDDRRFQDIVDEAKLLIPRYTPEWTDHNVSDPGVTLIELFAWMTDLILYRVNRVPEKSYLRFMDLLGIRLKDAVPARTNVTFWLSAPQPGPVTIPRGTEVSTVRTGEQQAISFATEGDLVLFPPTLRQCLTSSDDTNYVDLTERLNSEGEYFDAFQRSPLPGDALYFGFIEDIGSHILRLAIDCTVEGIGVDPKDPPLSWEAWCGSVEGWQRCNIERDETGGLNQTGTISLFLPEGMESRVLSRQPAYWVRVRVIQARPRQPAYSQSPRVNTVTGETIGGTMWATHSTVVPGEILGTATGIPGETFQLHNAPLLPRTADEHIEVQNDDEEGEWVGWEEVETFRDSHDDDLHYVIDGVMGLISFGPVIRQPNGVERHYGRTMQKAQPVRMTRYRYGGGVVGNVGANTLTVLKSSIPYVSRVTNRVPAVGGLDPESLESAKMRTPAVLRSQDRAVTAGDYEFLAMQASRSVARAKCIQVRSDAAGTSVPPGVVELLIVPLIPPDHERTRDSLQPSPELLNEVRQYLDDRRLLATQLTIDSPEYLGVSVEATIVVQRHMDAEAVKAAIIQKVERHLDPLHGGADGAGWPFGRDLYLAEVQSLVQSTRGVEYAQDVTLYQIDFQTGQSRPAGQKITLAEDVLLLSQEHIVNVVTRDR